VVAIPALCDGVAVSPARACTEAGAAALLCLALTAPLAAASAPLWWCATEAALLFLGLAAVVVIDLLLLASVLSEVAVLCLQLAAAVVIVSSPGALAPARPAAGTCLGPAAGASYAWPALLCAPDEGAWLPGAATSVNASLPRACVPL